MIASRTSFLFLILIFCFAAHAQVKPVYLTTGTIFPTENVNQQSLDSFNTHAVWLDGRTTAVLQFRALPNDKARKALSAAGIELLDYLPELNYTASIRGRLTLEIMKSVGVVSVFQLKASQKMDSRLNGNIPYWATKIPGTVDVLVSFPKTFSIAEVKTALKHQNIELRSEALSAFRILLLRISIARLSDLAALPCIEYVQAAPAGDQALNFKGRSSSKASALNASISAGGKGLLGEGVVVGVGDNADVQTHIDFSGRLINRSPMPSNGHGTHVTGTVGGGGFGRDYFRGFAPKATIISQGFNGILQNAAAYVTDYGMVITNNSYGDIVDCDYHGTYDLTSRWMDQMAIDLPYLENIFAAGNSGASTCYPFQNSYHTVLGGYQSAKNVLCVGAATDSGLVGDFSSKGPVRDGRIKPEITAMGIQVVSTWPTNIYSYNNGTSMAAPAVSGGMTLLYQRYRQLNAGANPKNGLMKAIMCNGATDRGTNGPDFQNGYGWLNLIRPVDMIENNHYYTSTVAAASINTHTVTVPAGTSRLKVLLYWNDPAASPLAAKTLVNDLDLEVSDGTTTTLPKILDTANMNLGNTATEAVDRRNNMEQVIIENPAAGSYTFRVKGSAITQGAGQEYFLAYDMLPANQLKITSPAGGETWIPGTVVGEMMGITWEAYGFSSGTINIDYSTDNGATWSSIATNVDINSELYRWLMPSGMTTQALVRFTKNGTGEVWTSQPFIITPLPVVSLNAVQCEGYISMSWAAIAGATDYEVMILDGDDMRSVAFTTANTYTIGGLSKNKTYWVTVRARINGVAGRRGDAISRQPNSGSCAGSISDNDMKLDAIISPVTGRMFTSSQPGSAAVVSVRIKNLDDASLSGFTVKYSVNGGTAVTEAVGATIAGGATYTHAFAVPVNLSLPGVYNIVAIVKYSGDPVAANDTAFITIKNLDNQPIDLTSNFIDDMESAGDVTYQQNTMGLSGLDRYDFAGSTPYARLRSFLNSGMAYSGSKALILDADRFYPAGNTNFLNGTYNLVGYSASSTDVRLDFRYNNHGQQPDANNKVWIRGSDADAWIEAYDLEANQEDPGTYKKTESIELSDLLAANGQNFSTSFAVRWGQWGQLPATDKNNAAGYSLDNVRLYRAVDDVQMKSIDAPSLSSCALSSATQITVTVRNSANNALVSIPVKYRIDNGAWVSENISSLAANTSVQYTFSTPANLSVTGPHLVEAVVERSSDSFHENDSASLQIINSPVISSFPSLESFETGTANWYSGGKNNSWEYGTPASIRIKGAANGAKAWKTRLLGNYNDNELSYLYSPCYNVSALSNPTLSFSVALDLEDCGSTLCDAAWIEYSADGISWTKLGANGTGGTNWYNNTTDQVWSVQSFSNWHVSTIPLPVGLTNLRLRFVMNSDAGVNREGIAIDDIHVYDNTSGIYDGGTMSSPVSAVVSGNNWIDFKSGGKLIASVQPNNQNLGSTDVQAYINSGAVRFTPTQYYHDRNITIKPSNGMPGDSVTVRFYFLDKEVDTLLKATGCASCGKPGSAYELGVPKYTDSDKLRENGTISDNSPGTWHFIPSSNAPKVPFDKGYYAEFKVKDFSEFWLSKDLLAGSIILPVKLMEFTAKRSGQNAELNWKSSAEIKLDRYEIEMTANTGSGSWKTLGSVKAAGAANNAVVKYGFIDDEQGKSGVRYYRLKMVNTDGSFSYSEIRSVSFAADTEWQVYPNPSSGNFRLLFQLPADLVATLTVMDSKGAVVQESVLNSTGQPQKAVIDLVGKPSGTYLLRIKTPMQTRSFKLYKQ